MKDAFNPRKFDSFRICVLAPKAHHHGQPSASPHGPWNPKIISAESAIHFLDELDA
jgi:hypothetical protein